MVSYQPDYIGQALPKILAGLPLTLGIMLVTLFLGSLLGFGLTYLSLSGESWARKLARSYIFVLRCTPPIVLLFMVFYGLPEFLHWWLGLDVNSWSRAIFVSISMVLLFGASSAEVFKSAYQAVPKGQTEAGLSIGLTSWQTLARIVMPQAFRIALPNLTSAVLTLMKDTALAYTIGLADVMGGTNLLIGQNLGNYSLETYTATAIIYWSLALVISFLSYLWEEHLQTVRRRSV